MNEKLKKAINICLNLFLVVAILFAGSVIYFKSTYVNIVVIGHSMNPTVEDYDMGYMKKVLKNTAIDRFDVVASKNGTDIVTGNENYLIKRVVGLPGEQVRIEQDSLFINGVEITQSFTHIPGLLMFEITLNEKEYLIYGDNRMGTIDPVAITHDEIIGKNGFINATCGSYNYSTSSCSVKTSQEWKWIK